MIFTSRYNNPELQKRSESYTIVRISVGVPRWLGYRLSGYIEELAPRGLLDIRDKREFEQRYRERLDRIGIERIGDKLRRYETKGKPVVLCCYEDVRKGGTTYCHRTMFAKWHEEQSGIAIPELYDPSPYERELTESPFMDLLSDII